MGPFEAFLPEHIQGGMSRYVEHGIEPGGFLYAVLCNDLRDAIGRASEDSVIQLSNIVSYCHNKIPGQCWGSREKVDAWIALHRRKREDESQLTLPGV